MSSHGYDYIIVGAGSAGCVVANRLSADPACRVLLLEAGGSDRNFWLKLPVGYYRTIYNERFSRLFRTEPSEGSGGRAIVWPRGRVLGGSSSINGLIFIRGQHEDFDDWERFGADGWSYRDVLPYFRRHERYRGGESQFHGGLGEFEVSDLRTTIGHPGPGSRRVCSLVCHPIPTSTAQPRSASALTSSALGVTGGPAPPPPFFVRLLPGPISLSSPMRRSVRSPSQAPLRTASNGSGRGRCTAPGPSVKSSCPVARCSRRRSSSSPASVRRVYWQARHSRCCGCSEVGANLQDHYQARLIVRSFRRTIIRA